MCKKKKIYIICLFFYLIIVFVTEIFYRGKLYKFSINFEEKIKQEGFLHYFCFFWSYIFIYGMLLIGTILVMFLYPLNILFCYVTIVVTLIFIMCLLKSIYINSRPYWDIFNDIYKKNNPLDKFPTECDGGFGNPSGHSLMSTSFLCLWYLLINSNPIKKFKKILQIFIKCITLFIIIICILSVTFSRIHRQVHSFNQIIFGTLLGISVFFTFCFIIEFDKMKPNEFINILDRYKYFIIPILLILFSISVILGYTRHNENETEYQIVLKKYCKYRREQIFGTNTAYHSGVIFIVIGGYLGLLFLKYKISKIYLINDFIFYNWNQGSKLKT
jgi:membrane-associated phospholipid phosphatase